MASHQHVNVDFIDLNFSTSATVHVATVHSPTPFAGRVSYGCSQAKQILKTDVMNHCCQGIKQDQPRPSVGQTGSCLARNHPHPRNLANKRQQQCNKLEAVQSSLDSETTDLVHATILVNLLYVQRAIQTANSNSQQRRALHWRPNHMIG
jgi:hypothetical protein